MSARGRMIVNLASQDSPDLHRTLAFAGAVALLAAGILAFGLSL